MTYSRVCDFHFIVRMLQ